MFCEIVLQLGNKISFTPTVGWKASSEAQSWKERERMHFNIPSVLHILFVEVGFRSGTMPGFQLSSGVPLTYPVRTPRTSMNDPKVQLVLVPVWDRTQEEWGLIIFQTAHDNIKRKHSLENKHWPKTSFRVKGKEKFEETIRFLFVPGNLICILKKGPLNFMLCSSGLEMSDLIFIAKKIVSERKLCMIQMLKT